jgi:hypothetical protein
MNIAICEYEGRVAPRLNHVNKLLIVQLDDLNKILDTKTIKIRTNNYNELLNILKGLSIDVIICGAIEIFIRSNMALNKIQVICNIIGDIGRVIKCYLEGNLSDDMIIL